MLKNITYTVFTVFIFIFVIVFIGETILRISSKEEFAKPIPHPPYDTAQKDDLLGWKMTPNYSFSGTLKDLGGVAYNVKIRYDSNGFKAYGNPQSDRPGILFIGDSYTASVEVSNEKSFFNIIRDSLNIEAFAYGHAGYGTLQEYMIFDKWLDVINPDIVVWNVCSNDFIDNFYELEMVCGYKVGERRPYLEQNGNITYQIPVNWFDKLQEKVFFFKWIEDRLENLKTIITGEKKHVGEYFIATEKRNFKPFDDSVNITTKIVGKIKKRLPKTTKLIAFSSDLYQPQLDEFKKIFEHYGFSFYSSPALLVHEYENNKAVVRASDGYHWNELGHKLIADGLITELNPLVRNIYSKRSDCEKQNSQTTSF